MDYGKGVTATGSGSALRLLDVQERVCEAWGQRAANDTDGEGAKALRARYCKALENFDWQFAFTDNHATWVRGSNALSMLRWMQRQVDPDGVLWMQAPGAQSHGAPKPEIEWEHA